MAFNLYNGEKDMAVSADTKIACVDLLSELLFVTKAFFGHKVDIHLKI